MDLTRAAIEKDRVTVVALLVALGAGAAAYRGMHRAEDPGFTVRIAQVTTLRPGMSPDRVERLITAPIEAAIHQMPEVESTTSTSRAGMSFVQISVRAEFDEMEPIWDDLRRRVQRAVRDLPAGVVGPMVNSADDIFGILVALTGDGYTHRELKTVAEEVRDELLLIDDAAAVDIYGMQPERIYVDYDDAQLAELGLSPLQLRSILESVNTVGPGGDVPAGTERIAVEPSGDFRSLDELRRTVVTPPGRAGIVHLEDLAEIHRGWADPPSRAVRASGAPAIVFGVSMRGGGDVTALGEETAATLDRLRAAYPVGVEFDIVAFQPAVVETLLRGFFVNLLQAVVIVLAVSLAFLGLRTGLVVATLVPMAMLAGLPVMAVLGIGIDQVTLAAMIISLGMLIDNAIVMAESIMVRIAGGRRPVDAAVRSARELRGPLLVSSLTTAAAFLPIFLAQSTTGEYTAPLFTVVTVTLLSSWILAITVTPMLCVRFLRIGPVRTPERFRGHFYRWYRRLLLAGLRHRALALAALAGLLVLALQGSRFIPRAFFPPSDKPTFTAEYVLPPGTSIERTIEVVEAVDRFIAGELLAGGAGTPGAGPTPDAGRGGVTNWVTFVGDRGPRFYASHRPGPPNPRQALSILNATSRGVITADLIPRLEAFCLEQFPDLEAAFAPLSFGPPVAAPVEVRLSGRDQDVLFGIVDTVKARMRSLRGAGSVTDDWGGANRKIRVEVDQPRARRAGVTSRDVAVSLQTALRGIEATRYRGGGDAVPVVLRSTLAHTGAAELDSVNVYSQAAGRAVPLLQVADPAVVWEPSTIRRRNRLRTVTVSSSPAPGVSPSEVVAQLRPWLEAERAGWPVGYRYAFGGDEEASVGANRSILEQLPAAALIILLLLVGQFNSIRRVAVIVLTIPLGLVGVVAGLLVTQSYFGFMTLLGCVALTGIVINNAIILIDRIEIEIDQGGLDPAGAIFEATQQRLRPILLTTATTVAGLVPLWVGGGPMWEPMAIAIIFGLLFATVLILGVVPILYSVFFRVRFDGFRHLRASLTIHAYPKIDTFLTRFAARAGWSGAMIGRIRAAAEETLLILIQQQEETAPPRRRLLVAARRDGGAAELRFVAAADEADIDDRTASFPDQTVEVPMSRGLPGHGRIDRSGGRAGLPSAVPIERELPHRLLQHYASSVRHQQHYDTDVVTVRVDAEPDAAPQPPLSGAERPRAAGTAS